MCNPEDFTAIANRIKQRRTELNLSLQDIAELTNMSKSTLQRYETGSIKNIPFYKLKSLARSLDTSAEWLLGWVSTPSERTSIDSDIETLFSDLGYSLITIQPTKTWDIYSEKGGGVITAEELSKLKSSIINYTKNMVDALIAEVNRRDEKFSEETNEKWSIYAAALEAGKSQEEAFREAIQFKAHQPDDPS